MAASLGVGTGLAVWAHDLMTKHRIVRKARRLNRSARGLVSYGDVRSHELLVGSSRALLLGAPRDVRDQAIAGLTVTSLAQGVPVVVITEGAGSLAAELGRVGCPNVEALDAAHPLYDPLALLALPDAVELMREAFSFSSGAPQEAGAYVEALARVLAHRGTPAAVCVMEACPHTRMHEVIEQLEVSGRIDLPEAADLRACLAVSPACRSFVQGFFHEALSEGALLADVRHMAQARSVMALASSPAPGALLLDVGSGRASSLLALVFAEIALCLRRGAALNVVVCAGSMANWDAFGEVLRSVPAAGWAVATDEALGFFSTDEELRRWVAAADRMLCFSQGHASAGLVSGVFGEYDKVDVSYSRNSGGSFGLFGPNFSKGKGATQSIKRERVVQPEEICGLAQREFFVMVSGQSGAGCGRAC